MLTGNNGAGAGQNSSGASQADRKRERQEAAARRAELAPLRKEIKNIEQKLGFDRIRELLKEKCNGAVAREFVEKIIETLRKIFLISKKNIGLYFVELFLNIDNRFFCDDIFLSLSFFRYFFSKRRAVLYPQRKACVR